MSSIVMTLVLIFALSIVSICFYVQPLIPILLIIGIPLIALVFILNGAYQRSFLHAYLQARKEKYCPRIQWQEKE